MEHRARKLSWLLCLAFALGAQPALAQRLDQAHRVRRTEITFQAEVDAPQAATGHPLIVQRKQWSVDELTAQFYAGKAVEVRKVEREGLPEDFVHYEFLCDGATSSLVRGYWTYCADEGIMAYLLGGFVPHPENARIAGLDTERAIGLLRDRAAALGLEPGSTPDVRAVEQGDWAALYREEYESTPEDDRARMTAPSAYRPPQAGYWIRMALCLDGIPIMRQSYVSMKLNQDIAESRLEAYVTAEGIAYFSVDGDPYEIAERKDGQIALSLEQAVDAFLKRYEKLATNAPVVVDRVAYEYVPAPVKGDEARYEARPAWCFYFQGGEDRFDRTGYATVYIDALTGKEIT